MEEGAGETRSSSCGLGGEPDFLWVMDLIGGLEQNEAPVMAPFVALTASSTFASSGGKEHL